MKHSEQLNKCEGERERDQADGDGEWKRKVEYS